MIEYYDWARGQLDSNHKPSVYDWSNMNMDEMAKRALAICTLAKDGTSDTPLVAFECLEKMAQAINERYCYSNKFRRRRRRW